MEHPSESLMTKLDVCASSAQDGPEYRHTYKPPFPPVLQNCLGNSKLLNI